MTKETTRRDILKGSLAVAGLGFLGIPEWAFPALAQGETLVPFTDLPDQIVLERTPDRRIIDVRYIDGVFTPINQFFTTQHYGHPEIDTATYRLRVSGLVDEPLALSLADLRAMPSRELIFGFECSGNRGPLNGLSSNGRWTGVPLRAVLERAGVKAEAREFVFFGADHGEEEVEFRGRTYTVDQQYGRSLPRDKALSDEPLLVHALNGEPLTRHQGRPLRLLVPGWYGAPNVKYLAEIHVQEDQYLGKYQARWYRTLKGEMVNGEVKWKETAIHADEAEVVHRARHRERRAAQRVRRRSARRHADPFGRGEGGRRSVAAGDARSGNHEREVLLEVLQLHLEWLDAGRAHAHLARDRRQRAGAADGGGAGGQEDLPRAQRAAAADRDDRLATSNRPTRNARAKRRSSFRPNSEGLVRKGDLNPHGLVSHKLLRRGKLMIRSDQMRSRRTRS